MRTVLLIGVVAGCRSRAPLPDVPIFGGTPELRGVVRAAMVAFDAEVGRGRVELRRVDIVDRVPSDTSDPLGGYRDHRIWLREDQDTIDLTARHELCHAIDFGEGIVAEQEAVYDELAAGFFATYPEEIEDNPTESDRREEVFAEFCEMGPLVAHSLAYLPCPDDPPPATAVAEHLMASVYTAWTPLEPITVDPAATVTPDGWSPDHPEVGSAQSPARVVVSDVYGQDPQMYDLYSGAWIDAPPSRFLGDPQGGPPIVGLEVHRRIGWTGGPAVVQGVPRLYHLNSRTLRAFARDGAPGWSAVVGCFTTDSLFVGDDRVWMWWQEGPVLRWAPLTR